MGDSNTGPSSSSSKKGILEIVLWVFAGILIILGIVIGIGLIESAREFTVIGFIVTYGSFGIINIDLKGDETATFTYLIIAAVYIALGFAVGWLGKRCCHSGSD